MTDNLASWASSDFSYHPEFLARREADRLLDTLWTELDWAEREIVLFGRRVLQPRLVAWYGDEGADYRYSGATLRAQRWPPVLNDLRARIERLSDCVFNAVLANAYRDGSDSMGWHSDDEPELGPRPCIASLSLGAERAFLLRPREPDAQGRRPARRLRLAHGSLLVMRGDSQARFQHSLPKTRQPVGLRINLTFRRVAPQDARAVAPDVASSPTNR